MCVSDDRFARKFFCSDALTYSPLASLGWEVDNVPWRTKGAKWDRYDVVVIRSTWDYSRHPNEFLETLEAIEGSGTQLANPVSIVRWNIDKRYLLELAGLGVTTVPTLWFDSLTHAALPNAFDQLATQEIVIKPTIGAGADDTFRLTSTAKAEYLATAMAPFQNKAAMIQPFLDTILDEGEYSLFYFAGKFSHAVRKQPKAGDFRVQEEHGGIIRRVDPDDELLQTADSALGALRMKLLYARVDLVRLSCGKLL